MAVYRGPDWVSRAGKSKEADVSVGLGTGSVDGTAAVSFEGCSESTDLLKNNFGRGSLQTGGPVVKESNQFAILNSIAGKATESLVEPMTGVQELVQVSNCPDEALAVLAVDAAQDGAKVSPPPGPLGKKKGRGRGRGAVPLDKGGVGLGENLQ